MEILRNLFDELSTIVPTLVSIGEFFLTPLEEVLTDFPIIDGLVQVGIFGGLLEQFPNITLFGFMFGSALSVTLIYSLVKWILDIVL